LRELFLPSEKVARKGAKTQRQTESEVLKRNLSKRKTVGTSGGRQAFIVVPLGVGVLLSLVAFLLLPFLALRRRMSFTGSEKV
jgi:Flp pilus assembly protein TadB